MFVIFFAVLAPLFSSRWRYTAALCMGMMGEIFSSFPFGSTVGLFLLITFFLELLEQRIVMQETIGWVFAAFAAVIIGAFGEALLITVFDHAPLSLALAILVSRFVVGAMLIGFLWVPIRLSLMHYKQR